MRHTTNPYWLVAAGAACCLGLLMRPSGYDALAAAELRQEMTPTQRCVINCRIPGTVVSVASTAQFSYRTWSTLGQVTVLNPSQAVSPRGSTVKVGEAVLVAGSFNSLGQLLATNVTVFTIKHIATMADDNYRAEGGSASAAEVNELVSYADSSGTSKSLADCHSVPVGCKAVVYIRPFALRDYNPPSCIAHPDADIVAASSESSFLHNTGYTDSAHRVYGYDKSGCLMWGMNPNSPDLQAWWRSYLSTKLNNYDLYFVDISSMSLGTAYWYYSGPGCLPWPSVCRSTQELPDDAALVAAHVNFVNAMTHPDGSPMYFLYQQAHPRLTFSLDLTALGDTNSYFGVTCEGCLAGPAPDIVNPANYASYLNEMAAVNQTTATFLIISKGGYATGSAQQVLQRLVTTGVTWLAYSEGHTIVQPGLERNTTSLAVWPEDLIYPQNPEESMVTGAADLEVAPGVYRREFAYCRQFGQHFGPCATVVNANLSAVTISAAWFKHAYSHVVTLQGGDVLSGGIANLTGAPFVPGLTAVQAGGALLLAP